MSDSIFRRARPRLAAGIGEFGRANLVEVYLSVRVSTAAMAATLNTIFAAVSGRPELWVMPLLSLPSIIDGLRRRGKPMRSILGPLTIDITGAGLFITLAGLGPVAVAYSLLIVAASGVFATRKQLRWLHPYVGGWMVTALAVSWIFDISSRWNPIAALVFTVFHVVVVAAALTALTTIVMRRLRETEEQRGRLIGGFTHDMRNALTGAVGIAELITTHFDDLERTDILEFAATVVTEGREAVAMTEDLLTVARAEANRLQVSAEQVDLAEEAARVIGDAANPANAAVEVTSSSQRVVCVGDPVRIRQIIRNLLSNARRYGGDRIRVTLEVTDTRAILQVADSGTAIAVEDHDRIFDAYQRANSRPRHAESVGLGLTISRHVARLMGGDLSYHHTDGWSIFELTLPAAFPPATPWSDRIGEAATTRVERIWLGTDGILRTLALNGAEISLEDARAGVEAYMRVADGQKRPLLVYAENIHYLASPARSFYTSSSEANECILAVAFLVESSPVARLIANQTSRLGYAPFPSRLFDDEGEALNWLRKQQQGALLRAPVVHA